MLFITTLSHLVPPLAHGHCRNPDPVRRSSHFIAPLLYNLSQSLHFCELSCVCFFQLQRFFVKQEVSLNVVCIRKPFQPTGWEMLMLMRMLLYLWILG